jgi:uncharacterized paraquat-inducible protein A
MYFVFLDVVEDDMNPIYLIASLFAAKNRRRRSATVACPKCRKSIPVPPRASGRLDVTCERCKYQFMVNLPPPVKNS